MPTRRGAAGAPGRATRRERRPVNRCFSSFSCAVFQSRGAIRALREAIGAMLDDLVRSMIQRLSSCRGERGESVVVITT
ncbi:MULTISPECIES: hypothetical protein [Sorangium]|uniref:hypothetical protein n=1 Tax=Sorangium TaxID=39643 RepID=UPI003D9C0475